MINKFIYLINDREVKRTDFYDTLFALTHHHQYCCIHEVEACDKQYKKYRRDLLYGLIRKIGSFKFEVKRV